MKVIQEDERRLVEQLKEDEQAVIDSLLNSDRDLVESIVSDSELANDLRQSGE